MSVRGRTIHSQAREIVNYVYKTIQRTKNEDKKRNLENPNKLLASPGKKRKRDSILEKVDDFDFQVIRRTIEDFYLNKKIVPTIPKLLLAIREKIEFPWDRDSLRKLIKANGFYFRKCQNKRKLLVEKPHILHWRFKYLRSIKKYREQGRNIVYMDETWIDSDLTFKKCWQRNDVFGVATGIRSSGRLIVVDAGSENGFVDGAKLVFKAGLTTGDYHGNMNEQNFMKWICEKLLPNIPAGSVIVLDNAPYHSVIEDKVPTKSSLKSNMLKWLQKNDIPFDPKMRKVELFEIILANKPQEEVKYKLDNFLTSQGHIPLRLPPYMCEFNPIELAWAKVKHFVRQNNTGQDFSIKKLIELTDKAIESVTIEDWKKFVAHVRRIEHEFWEKDGILEDVIDNVIINLGPSDSDSESEVSLGSDSDLEDF